MTMDYIPIQLGWFDFVVVILLGIGVSMGRRRGVSEELFGLSQWLVIVVACGFGYSIAGQMIMRVAGFSQLWAYIIAYALLALTIKVMFSKLHERLAERFASKETFGSGEYYFGMVAGAGRVMCITLVWMAFLNAKYVSDAQHKATAKMQHDNFGDIRFPTLGSLQRDVFSRSASGNFVKQYLGDQLISTLPQPKRKTKKLQRSVAKNKEQAISDIIDGE